MAHSYAFCLFAMLVFHTPRYLQNPNIINSLLLGVIAGWIVLIRPTNAIALLYFIGHQVYSLSHLKTRLLFFLLHVKSVLLIALAACVMIFPQLLYWKEMTGHWVYYSYTTESFTHWKAPKIAAVLLDVQNGLLLYSPMVVLMLTGIIIGVFRKKFHAIMLLFIFIGITYMFASWWAWWFGGAFGHRCYVEYYALLAIPLAGCLSQWTVGRPVWMKYSVCAGLVVLCVYSVRLSDLYTSIGGPWDGADWRWNWDKYEWIMQHFFA